MSQFQRRPYTGSCHCGHVKYIAYISFPSLPYPKTTPMDFHKESGHRMYKCNCTICHKAGLFHLRLLDAANDFFVISPKDPFANDRGYKSYGSWRFCEKCGVRPFSIRGTGYNDEVDLPTSLLQRVNSRTLDGTTGEITAKDGETTRVQVWRPKKDWKEATDDPDETSEDYLSVNVLTLDAHNDNFNLSQLQESGYVGYFETLQTVGYDLVDKPFFGGTY